MNAKEFVENWEQIKKDIFKRTPKCGVCKTAIPDGYAIDKKNVCSDCYFDAFGEEIEKHPIGLPRMRRIV